MSIQFNTFIYKTFGKLYVEETSIQNKNNPDIGDLLYTMYECGVKPSSELLMVLTCATTEKLAEIQEIVCNESLTELSWNNVLLGTFPFNTKPSQYEMVVSSFINYVSHGLTFDIDNKIQLKDRINADILIKMKDLKEIGLFGKDDMINLVKGSLASKDHLPKHMLEVLPTVVNQDWFLSIVNETEITMKETLAVLNAEMFKAKNSIIEVKTLTDILRLLNVIGSQNSAKLDYYNCPKLSRQQRRVVVHMILSCLSKTTMTQILADVKKYQHEWVVTTHQLHIGEHFKKFPVLKKFSELVRETRSIKTFNSDVERLIDTKRIITLAQALKHKPSEFMRRIDKMIRVSDGDVDKTYALLQIFRESLIENNVNSKIVIQLIQHFQNRTVDIDTRVYKRANGSTKVVNKPLKAISQSTYGDLMYILEKVLINNYKNKPTFSKNDVVYIDESAFDITLPKSLDESSSEGIVLGKGSKVKINMTNESVLRLFLHWKGDLDVDLHGVVLDDKFNNIDSCSFYSTSSDWYQHSGDIRSAPNGAAEYIDFDISKAPKNARYIMLTASSYSNVPFKDIDDCFVGYMVMDEMTRNCTIPFQPKLVEHKFKLSGNSTSMYLVLFDIKYNKLIWVEVAEYNNVYGDVKSTMENLTKKSNFSVSDLIKLHVNACDAKLTLNKNEATVCVGIGEDIDPLNFVEINSKYL